MSSHAYAGRSDFDALTAFVRDRLVARWPRVPYWHPGDVTWNLYPELDSPEDDLRIWTDASGVAAYSWLEGPAFVRFDVRDDAPLANEILDRAEAQGQGRELETPVLESDRERQRWLDARGYTRTGRGNVHMRRGLGAVVDAAELPRGLHFRTGDEVDPAERAACHRDAWSNLAHLGMGEVTSSFSLERYRRLRAEPGYRADLDLVVQADDGTCASCLIAWADETSGVGLIEPVGTRARWRGRGLAVALNLEAQRRLREAGMRHVQVATPGFNAPARSVYARCGFEIVDRDRSWAKRL